MLPNGETDIGSSPRARGAVCLCARTLDAHRIIPARAGSSSREVCRGPESWDHPRARGEQIVCVSLVLLSMGSSPRARGAVSFENKQDENNGIIPARAGSRTACRELPARS